MSLGVGLGQTFGSVRTQATHDLVVAASGYYFDFRTSAGYTLSGSSVLTVVERRTSTSIAANSTTAAFQATGLSGGPCINFTTDPYSTSLAGLLAVATNNSRFSVIVSGSFNTADANGNWCSWDGATSTVGVGQTATGAGFKRIMHTNDAATATTISSTQSPDTNAHIHRYEVWDNGSNFAGHFYTDGTEDSGGAKTFNKPTTLTPTSFTLGGLASSIGGRIAVLVIIPGDPNTLLNERIEATL